MKRPIPALPILLGLLALVDLRFDLRLLADHFTFTTLWNTVVHHALAVLVLLLLPDLWRRYR
ncbi:hypothetical protein IQ216_10740 [Cyanobium sp. LEGE 06143]|uniref:hypothetical protein n=1 Tax=unclassified Cyanobium TaxID=2627006 RepID=UPI0016469F6B|nr:MULTISPECIES: hypothetical protein [unclassified Cyanobium]MBE9153562.1 hypothetical protein [Cyanobium sp. LEGE 06113]MBE9173530.1 hypothetical protein [Cyanobium sp. LEGE 06143]QNI70537.1 putative conserved membrane protein [Cyanobium sp. NS01]